MRLHAVLTSALCSTAALIGHVSADDLDDLGVDASSSSVAESSTTGSKIERPTFTVSDYLLSWS